MSPQITHQAAYPDKILLKQLIPLVTVAIAGLIGGLYVISASILLNQLKQAETYSTRQAAETVITALEHVQEDLGSTLTDWASWDDTYAFIQDGDQTYIDSNLTPDAIANLHLNLILFVQPSGRIIYGTGFDETNQAKIPIPKGVKAHLAPSDPLLSQHSGILLLPEGPMLIVSRPILNSQGEGPARGVLIFGRYLGNDDIQDLSAITRLSIRVQGLHQAPLPPDFAAVWDTVVGQQTTAVRHLDEQTIAGYLLLTDIYGEPAAMLRADVPRAIYQQGQDSLRYLLVTLLTVGVVFGGVSLLLLQKLLLALMARQQAQAALHESHRRQAILTEVSPVGIFHTDAQGECLYVNEQWCKITGLPLSQALGSGWVEAIHRDDRERVLAEWSSAVQKRTPFRLEYRVQKPDGTLTWVLGQAIADLSPNGMVAGYVGSITNLTERKEFEAFLQRTNQELGIKVKQQTTELREAIAQLEQEMAQRRQSEQRLKSLMTNTPGAIYRCAYDMTWTIEFISDAILDICGYPAADFIHNQVRSLVDIIPAEDLTYIKTALSSAIASKDHYALEYRMIHANGSIRWVYEKGQGVFNENGELLWLDGVIFDVTERKRAETEILRTLEKERELSELKSRFVSMISHEFRTPLTTIQSSADLLAYFDCNATERQGLFQQIQTAIRHMVRLLEDALVLGQAEAGTLNCQPTWFNLERFCCALVLELETSSSRPIMFVPDQGASWVCLDEKLVRQILTNLLSNAVKYSPKDSLIQFELGQTSNSVIFRIQDQGIGIPENEQPRIFQFFHRASNVGTISGTGVGLAIVKQCVDLHRGTIWVESAIGKGTTFTVMLPLQHEGAGHEDYSGD